MGRRVSKAERDYRRAVAIEYIQSGKDRNEICLRYGVKNQATLSNWVASYLTPYEIETKCVHLHQEKPLTGEQMIQQNQDQSKSDKARIEALEKQVKELEAKLKRSKDKELALNTLIDIAEEQGIRIRKKSGAKQ